VRPGGRRGVATLCILATALAAGCGGDDGPRTEKEQIADAITRFNRAFSKGDGEATCKLITDQYRQSIELGHDEPCARAVEQEAGSQGPEHEQVKALGKARPRSNTAMTAASAPPKSAATDSQRIHTMDESAGSTCPSPAISTKPAEATNTHRKERSRRRRK